ncbi:outer membrane efflux protein [Caballeronia arationis]|uniref:TolC family protein n=1 Tax=Caballeronia arationis TaxID=1777142 RepID=UPI00074C23EE|nr:TolC family protein [Caballeronia arationis]SAK93048.1 outer membrane efflux protein [Caballeronia arationis]
MLSRHLAAVLAIAAAIPAYAQSILPPVESGHQAPADAAATTTSDVALTPMSLDDALGIAAENNPLLRGARADANATQGTFMQAGARPNPEISFLQEGFGGPERTTTALLNQTVELGGKRRARLDVASYGREVALASLDGRGAALRSDVVAAFYGLLAAQRQLQVAQESADIAVRSAELAGKRSRAGKVSPVEATKARVAATGVQIELANARTRVSTAVEKLASVTGSPLVRGRSATGDIETVPAVAPLSQLLERLSDAPLSRVARAEMLRSNAAISVERAKRVPDITVSAGMKRVITGGIRDNQAVVGISIPLPLFDTNKGALLEAVHKAEKAGADFDSEKARLQLELTQAYASYESSTQAAQQLKADVLPAAREALDAMSRGYELGKFSFLDVLDAQRTFFQGQSQYVQALTDAHLAYADIGRLVGMPLRSDAHQTTNLP